MNLTEPSAKTKLPPPGCWLRKLYQFCPIPTAAAPVALFTLPARVMAILGASQFSGMAVEPTDWLAWTQAFHWVTLMICSPARKVLLVPSVICASGTPEHCRQKIPLPVAAGGGIVGGEVFGPSPSCNPRQL